MRSAVFLRFLVVCVCGGALVAQAPTRVPRIWDDAALSDWATPVAGLYSCSAGCHPAGSVIGAAGHNAAMRILKDLGRTLS